MSKLGTCGWCGEETDRKKQETVIREVVLLKTYRTPKNGSWPWAKKKSMASKMVLTMEVQEY